MVLRDYDMWFFKVFLFCDMIFLKLKKINNIFIRCYIMQEKEMEGWTTVKQKGKKSLRQEIADRGSEEGNKS